MFKSILFKIILLCLIALDVFLINQFIDYRDTATKDYKAHLKQLTIKAASDIDNVVEQIEESSKRLSSSLTHSSEFNKENIKEKLAVIVAENDLFYGASITFKPYAFNKYRRLYSMYASKNAKDDAIEYLQLDDIYDYTEAKFDWYVDAMKRGDRWSKPYWDDAGKTYMITYSALFYSAENQQPKDAIGMVTVDLSMATIRNIIESLNLDASGFGALTTNEGDYLYHPNYQYVRDHLNLLDVANDKDDQTRKDIAPLIKKGESGVVDHISTTTKEKTWLFYQPIPRSGWSLQNTFFKSNIDISTSMVRQQLILITVVSLITVILFINIALPQTLFGYRHLTLSAAISSVLLTCSIWMVWALSLNYNDTFFEKGTEKITNINRLEVLVEDFRSDNAKKELNKTYFISTGIQVDTIDFSGTNDIAITGRVWQIYPDDYPEKWVKGFEIGRSTKLDSKLIEKRKIEGGEVHYWRIQALIRTNLDYSHYPLEIENINIPIVPKKNGTEVALIPNLKAYKFISPGLLPGLADNIFLPGWDISQSYFSLVEHNARTNLGINGNFDQRSFSALHFNVGIKRQFIDAFISNLTPLIVVIIILYSVVLLPTNIDISRTLGICVSVFFVVIFSHLAIRRAISIDNIFYLEYFYLVIYAMVIIAPLNSFRVTLGMTNKWLDYENGLLIKASFWPVVLSIFLTITVLKFY